MKYSRFFYLSWLIVLAFCVPGGEFFGYTTNFHFRDFLVVSHGIPDDGSGAVFFLFSEQTFPLSRTYIRGKNQLPWFYQTAVFALLMLLLLAALSRAFTCICKLFRFYTRFFFNYLVNALLLGGCAPPAYSFS
jgi:hypothetical protein